MSKDYLVTFLSTGGEGVQYANTISVHDDELGGTRDVSDVVDLVDTWLTSKYRAMLPTSTHLSVLRCFRIPDVYGDDSNVALKDINLAGTGNVGDGQMGREVTLTLTLRSQHTSRRKMGRLSIPSPEDSATLASSGAWDVGSNFYDKVGQFADALLAGHDVGIGGVEGHLSTRIYSRKQHKEGTGDKTTDVDTYKRQPRPRWLRRRVSIP